MHTLLMVPTCNLKEITSMFSEYAETHVLPQYLFINSSPAEQAKNDTH